MRCFPRLSAVSLLSLIAFGASPTFANSVVATVIAQSTAVVAGGISPTRSLHPDHDPHWFFTPHVTAAYFSRLIHHLDVGAGAGVHFWAIFAPNLALRGFFIFDERDLRNEVGFTASVGPFIGRYNDAWHDGLAITLAPNIDFVQSVGLFKQDFAVRVGIEATLFHTGEASLDRYQPVLALGAALGLAFPILWTRIKDPPPEDERIEDEDPESTPAE
jgi:hypothetical protein